MISNQHQPARYDLLAFNLVLAAIAALLMASVGSSLQVVQLLEGTEIAGLEIDLAVGVAVNLGIITASATIFFAMARRPMLCLAQLLGTGQRCGNRSGCLRMDCHLNWSGVIHGDADYRSADAGGRGGTLGPGILPAIRTVSHRPFLAAASVRSTRRRADHLWFGPSHGSKRVAYSFERNSGRSLPDRSGSNVSREFHG